MNIDEAKELLSTLSLKVKSSSRVRRDERMRVLEQVFSFDLWCECPAAGLAAVAVKDGVWVRLPIPFLARSLTAYAGHIAS
jgi:hypothetical protein